MAKPSRPDMDLSGTMLDPPPGLDPDCLLFLGDPTRKTYTAFGRVFYPAAGALTCFLTSLYMANLMRIPYRAGIHRHIWAAIAGGGTGEGIRRYTLALSAERDLQYYQYMVLHPEDFQAPERKKWADVLQRWVPCR